MDIFSSSARERSMYRKALKYCSRKEDATSAFSRLSKVCNMATAYAPLAFPRNCFFDSAGPGGICLVIADDSLIFRPCAKARMTMISQQPQPSAPARATGWKERWPVAGICLVLAAITFAVFGQTLTHEFINFDDSDYVYENPVVARGVTLKGIVWAFSCQCSNWHPLTWLSHMLDCQLYGLHPAGHHLTNVLLHTATVIVLFLVLRQMTGTLWRSAFVAAVFAIHPLRVESVAWVAERKDVLSGLFFMLTIGAYVRYARRPWSWGRYGLVLLLFAMGLMSKPMLVTLPLVLLLLDFWPLQRAESTGRLVTEKLPLLALSAVSCVATILAQHQAIQSVEYYSLPHRLGNALVTCLIYLRQMVWPAGLAAFYPYPLNG